MAAEEPVRITVVQQRRTLGNGGGHQPLSVHQDLSLMDDGLRIHDLLRVHLELQFVDAAIRACARIIRRTLQQMRALAARHAELTACPGFELMARHTLLLLRDSALYLHDVHRRPNASIHVRNGSWTPTAFTGEPHRRSGGERCMHMQ